MPIVVALEVPETALAWQNIGYGLWHRVDDPSRPRGFLLTDLHAENSKAATAPWPHAGSRP